MTSMQSEYFNRALTAYAGLNQSLGALKTNGAPAEIINRLLDKIEECRKLVIHLATIKEGIK